MIPDEAQSKILEETIPTSNPVEPTNPLPSLHSTLRSNSLIIVVLIAVCVITLIPSGLYFLGNNRSRRLTKKTTIIPTSLPSLLSPTPIPTITPTSTPSASIANWKIYTNTTYRYSLQYPSDWTFQEDTSNNVTFYPPYSIEFAKLTENDNHPGAGLSPQINASVITHPFVTPSYQFITLSTHGHVQGYYYTAIGAPFSNPTFDLPLNNGTKMLEFSLLSIGQENIDQSNKDHNTNIQIKDIDESMFKEIIQSLTFLK